MTRKDIAEMLGITKESVYYREKKLGILGQPYTEINIMLLTAKPKNAKLVRKYLSPVKIEIINLHLLGKSNYNIGEITKIHWRQINNTIAEYINNDRSIFVESKLNFIN